MSKIALSPSSTGTAVFTIAAPGTNINRTFTLPDEDGEILTSASLPKFGAPGQVAFFASSSAPTGWLKANGATVSRTTYAALFAAIGTTFGVGDGSTTFELPDMRGEFIRGWDDGRGIDTGRIFGSAQVDEFKSHTHTATHVYQNVEHGGTEFVNLGATYYLRTPLLTTSSSGGTETRPRNVALLACIKY